METLRELFHLVTDVEGMIRWGGYVALAAIVFTETGLMIGFFLPGDSLLVTAGLFAAKGDLNIVYLNLLLITMAILGDATGYFIGKKLGPALFRKESSRFFKKEHLIKTQLFYERHGGKTIIIARFIPIIRTFAPVVAGIAQMKYRRFAAFNVFGGIGWVVSMTMIGYLLGRLVPNIDKYIEIIIIVVVFLSILPGIIQHWSARRANRRAAERFKEEIRDVITRLQPIGWEWSRSAVDRIANALGLSVSEVGQTTSAEASRQHLVVHEDDQSVRAVEISAHTTADSTSLSEAGYQNAQWEYAARFRQAVDSIAEILGPPTRKLSRTNKEHGLPAEVVESASWPVNNGQLTMIHAHEKRGEPFHIAIRVEPPS